jgi:hypothetical protein
MKDGKIYRFGAHSRVFLERAKAAVEKFKLEDDPQQLLIAALMLRQGIEARLFEYIEAELPADSRKEKLARISDYQATKLLARLTRMNPDAQRAVQLRITSEQTGNSFGMCYTPVTDSLARIHGRLGELLHNNYFRKNPYWFIADRLNGGGLPTLLHGQDLVEQGILELCEATSGALLSHPQFKAAVQEIVEELDTEVTDTD